MLKYEQIGTTTHPTLFQIKILYEEAFPMHERRSWHALMQLLQQPKMNLIAITEEDFFIGFVIYWQLKKWLYVEHLAIATNQRGRQYGSTIVKHLQTKRAEIVIETELPTNEESLKRVEFYKRLGFRSINYPYCQPPYRKEESSFPMLLMATTIMEEAEYELLVNEIRHEVYEQFY